MHPVLGEGEGSPMGEAARGTGAEVRASGTSGDTAASPYLGQAHRGNQGGCGLCDQGQCPAAYGHAGLQILGFCAPGSSPWDEWATLQGSSSTRAPVQLQGGPAGTPDRGTWPRAPGRATLAAAGQAGARGGDVGDPLWKAGSSPGRPESVTNGQNVRVMESKHGRPGHGLWPRQSLAAVCLTSPSVFLLISRTQIGKEISLQMLRCRNAPSRQGSSGSSLGAEGWEGQAEEGGGPVSATWRSPGWAWGGPSIGALGSFVGTYQHQAALREGWHTLGYSGYSQDEVGRPRIPAS